jgi:hypothetical protein
MEAEGSLHVRKSPPPSPILDEMWCTKMADAEVTLFTRIRKVLGSNNGRDTSYPAEMFRGFLSPSMQILR